MRILVLSDLHVEEAPFRPAAFDADLVVLAGDVANGAPAVRWARAAFPRHRIVQVAGNHEFYDGEHAQVLASLRDAAREEGVDFLENDALVVGGVRFLGCTLWTDFRLYETPGRPREHAREEAMAICAARVPDFGVIRVRDGEGTRAFSPADSAALHDASRRWLAGAIAVPFDGPTVVVTHHLPTWRSVHPRHARWSTSATFASDVDELVERVDCWIHGHTHVSWRYAAGAASVVCNPRGYPAFAMARMGMKPPPAPGGGAAPLSPGEVFENPDFDPCCVVEIGSGGDARPLG